MQMLGLHMIDWVCTRHAGSALSDNPGPSRNELSYDCIDCTESSRIVSKFSGAIGDAVQLRLFV